MTFQRIGDIDYFLISREWSVLRMRALERDGARCSCCGRTAANGVRMNVDHIKPRVRYPELALTLDNLQVLCSQCNEGKGNKYKTDWRGITATGTPKEEQRRQEQLAKIKELQEAASNANRA